MTANAGEQVRRNENKTFGYCKHFKHKGICEFVEVHYIDDDFG